MVVGKISSLSKLPPGSTLYREVTGRRGYSFSIDLNGIHESIVQKIFLLI
jgi:hypothetical protein